ncbi:E3 UFM1-protein ligase 1 homolog [Coccinella septempunctata]|uniref:E3 UFM1-protein ligase 1 homolog n=1 Tax=Coccinella septempunctata TaxID=41139 RepID=UPI001D06EEEC|nr:E3 UFM1-protein ligase 1 homolog [Coccinella septempunctata]
MTEWEEVKRLAADFQKVQLGSSTQRLSERNCIEIISWLREKNMIDLIFSSDGKECLTPDQLLREMQDEIYGSGGRIDIVDLAKTIGVDLAHINNHLNSLLKHQKNLHFIVGQLIDSTYINKIVMEINEKLTAQGQINVNDLSIHYDLPGEFLQQILEKNLNKSLFGKQDKNDPKVFFTEYFIARNVAKMRGALFGLTKPTPVASILYQIEVAEKLFFSLFDQTLACGSLTSRLVGAQYIPDVHSKSVHKWVSDFFSQNSYLEYDTLKKLGISDYESYVKKLFKSEKIILLDSCLISNDLLDRLLDEVEDCISSMTFTDVQSVLPSVFNEADISILIELIMTPQRKQQIIVLDNFIVSLTFIEKLTELCKSVMEEKANKCVESGLYQEYKIKLQMGSQSKILKSEDFEEKVDKREERRKKAAGGKSGGGTQGRETKTKSTKKVKGNTKNLDTVIIDNSDSKQLFEILTKEDVLNCIENTVNNAGLDLIIEQIVEHILEKLNLEALKIAENIYATTVLDQTANRRHTHNELQQKLNNLISDIRLFEKGIKLLPADLQVQLYKYLLKSVCTDIVNEILTYVAQENNLTANFTNNDQRIKFTNELQPDIRNLLLPLVKALSSKNIDDFMAVIDDALGACSMILKKIDKKKDRVIVLNHKQKLLEQLNKCDDPALVLHLAVLVIFTTATQCMLHASGRHLQQILTYLKQYLTPEQIGEMTTYHDYVTLMLSGGSEEENVRQKLKEMIPIIRNIANEFKKPTSEKS